jgi:hypothetical protein
MDLIVVHADHDVAHAATSFGGKPIKRNRTFDLAPLCLCCCFDGRTEMENALAVSGGDKCRISVDTAMALQESNAHGIDFLSKIKAVHKLSQAKCTPVSAAPVISSAMITTRSLHSLCEPPLNPLKGDFRQLVQNINAKVVPDT